MMKHVSKLGKKGLMRGGLAGLLGKGGAMPEMPADGAGAPPPGFPGGLPGNLPGLGGVGGGLPGGLSGLGGLAKLGNRFVPPKGR